ncbi:hypothetical protein RIF29_21258 [Crotalaria pallida]|uniref:RING-type domain-containing protein n=1 Tax=Crotalaria pallida TaxID=3830 RepID=A0AAN9F2P7_CROPI
MDNTTSNSDDNLTEDSNSSYFSIGLYVGFLILIMFIVLTSYYCTLKNFQNRQSNNRVSGSRSSSSHSHRTVVMDQEAIVNHYPVLLYSQAKLDNKKLDHSCSSSTLSCSICLADYKDSDSELLRLLPDCGHFFHKECVDMWLRLNMSCPVCRNSPFPTPLPTPLAEVTPLATRGD